MTESMFIPTSEKLPAFSVCSEPAFDAKYMEEELKIPPNLFSFASIVNLFGMDTFPTNLTESGNNTLEHIWNMTTIKPPIIAIGDAFFVDDEPVGDVSEVVMFDMDVVQVL